MPQKVVIIQELFSSYRGPIFDRLNGRYDLLVLHGKRSSDLKLIEKPYSSCVLSFYFFKNKFVFLSVFSALRHYKPGIVIHQGSPGILSLPLTWIWCRFNNVRFVLWTHGFERHQGFKPKKSFRSWLRLLYFRLADGVLFYTKQRRNFFQNILPLKKLFYANNTVDTTHLLAIRDLLRLANKDRMKKDLKMDGHFNIAFIGRLLKDKLADHLLKATALLKERKVNVKTHIIGDGKEMEVLQKLARELGVADDVIFYGALFDDAESGKILFFSDVMVMPGYIGLAINHAYCLDLPVITYRQGAKGPFHSPEIDYLVEGKTGLLIESYNIHALTDCLMDLYNNPSTLDRYRENVSAKISELTIEKMEDGFVKCIDQLLYKH